MEEPEEQPKSEDLGKQQRRPRRTEPEPKPPTVLSNPAAQAGYDEMQRITEENMKDPMYLSDPAYRLQKDQFDMHGNGKLFFEFDDPRKKMRIPDADEQMRINTMVNDIKERLRNKPKDY